MESAPHEDVSGEFRRTAGEDEPTAEEAHDERGTLWDSGTFAEDVKYGDTNGRRDEPSACIRTRIMRRSVVRIMGGWVDG